MDYIKQKNLIPDGKLQNVQVDENNEKLVQLFATDWLHIKNFSAKVLGISRSSAVVRKTVFDKLKLASHHLPDGYSFLLIDSYRSIEWQLERFLIRFAKTYQENPDLSFKKLYWNTSKLTAPIWGIVPPHTTGGAVDITLLKDGKELDMGTGVNEFNKKTSTLTKYITKQQKNNRKIMIDILHKAGFINYPTEWWHWSYGDQYWAAINRCNSIYGAVKWK